MRLTEAGQFDAMRSIGNHPAARERQKQPVFPRDSKSDDHAARAASRGERHCRTVMIGECLTATPFRNKAITFMTDSVASVNSQMQQVAFAGRCSDSRLLKLNAITKTTKSSLQGVD
ncbi:hypothetical protein [Bradyrhizobium glycinis]|uniref:hypothetical protein n=1 Tax=Bradyrhizobium glycinis TaxID=2751812 RepID=UPI0018D6BFD0|nr:hypothetical protein [Bradyrhizobium glycinis]MBH5372009.1 hypothetical protein [Bradyrhizobium glycinis]